MRRLAPDPSRVHAITLAIWLSGVVALALLWTFPRFFGALLLLSLAVAAYGLLYVFIEARMAGSDFSEEEPVEKTEPFPEEPPVAVVRRARTRRSKPAIVASPAAEITEASAAPPAAAPPAVADPPPVVAPRP